MPGGACDLWQALGSEHHERDYANDCNLRNADVKHTKALEELA
jgi:hypothetical protein